MTNSSKNEEWLQTSARLKNIFEKTSEKTMAQILKVSPAESGQKIFNFLERRVQASSSELHKWIRTGQIRVNSGRVKAFDRVQTDDEVRVPPFAALQDKGISMNKDEKDGFINQDSLGQSVQRIFENDDILVLNKPQGLPVQGGTGHTISVVSLLQQRYAGAEFIPAPAHRLDKNTSGILLVGKSYRGLRVLSDLMREHSMAEFLTGTELYGDFSDNISKEYLVWCSGKRVWQGTRRLIHYMYNDEDMGRMVALKIPARLQKQGKGFPDGLPALINEDQLNEAKLALCDAECLESRGAFHLMRVRLFTGRKHQIRVQLAAVGLPVVGDERYGTESVEPMKLHCRRIVLPASAAEICPEQREFIAEPDWQAEWQAVLSA